MVQTEPQKEAPPRRRGVCVLRLTLTDFRNYRHLRLDMGEAAAPVVVTGPNGAGKTNLFEALSLLVSGRGLKKAGLTEPARHGADGGWTVAARIDGLQGAADIGTGIAPRDDGDGWRREIRLNGAPAANLSALGAHYAAVWLVPHMDGLFRDGSAGRRRFIDRLAGSLYAPHGRELAAYERAMRERLRLLLKRGAGGNESWLSALEAQMAEHAVAVAAMRLEAMQHLSAALGELTQTGFPAMQARMTGLVEEALATASALEAEEKLAGLLAESREDDRASAMTHHGIHRSDMRVTHAAKAMPADQASTGEQKVMLAGLVLAQTQVLADQLGRAPVVLLDEVTAHLDTRHRGALFGTLMDLGCQFWASGTDETLFEGLGDGALRIAIEDGRVVPHGLENGA